MDIEDYSMQAFATADYPRVGLGVAPGEYVVIPNIVYPITKLTGEAGEVSEKFGKLIRDEKGLLSLEFRKELILELGDVLWYINAIALELGVSLSEVAERNLAKLASRKERGVIHGSGDHR